MKRLLAIIAGLAALCASHGRIAAQTFTPDFGVLTVFPDGQLRAPLGFFKASSNRIHEAIGITNIPGALAGKAPLANAYLVQPGATNLTTYGTLTVAPNGGLMLAVGSGFLAPAGAPMSVDTLVLTKSTDDAGDFEPARKVYVDLRSINLVDNLAALRSHPVPLTRRARATVISDTVTGGISDGARGDWYWNPTSTSVEDAVCQRSATLSPSAPGRWIKLN